MTNWTKEFDKLFPPADGYEVNYDREALKSFITSLIERERADEREEIRKWIVNKFKSEDPNNSSMFYLPGIVSEIEEWLRSRNTP